MRKGLKWLLCGMVLLLAAALSGCTVVSTDVTALMNPPKLTKQQQAIEQALASALGGGSPTLKYPHNGDYRSSFVLHSFDHGATNSVLAFYSPTKEKSGTHIMVLHQAGSKWKETCDISGDGNEVDRIVFGDFDGSGTEELAVGWTSFTSTDMALGIYAFHGNNYEKIYRDTYTEMIRANMTGGNRDDLLLLKLDGADKKASAELVGAAAGSVGPVSQAPLDSTVTGYAGLYPTSEDGSPAVLIDSRKGPDKMVTEMVLWKNGQLTSPLYDPDQKMANAETLRDVSVTCQDIDGDGSIEIPVPIELPGYEEISGTKSAEKIWKVQWMIWKNGALVPKLSSVINSTEGYTFLFPAKWETGTQTITVQRENGDSDWAFYEWNPATRTVGAHLFDILAYSSDVWSTVSANTALQRIDESDGMVYAYQADAAGANSPYMLDIGTVRQQFKLVD
ncbi:hypothetical protein [Ethanoligenens harbinense]|uniref:VCBS repeat-containing protein n=1 Tax=Ethanoligenens harbinense (strain DSM 18485 / JCM 12961 / CGMCC 1.5033 / YUAN-3) TaxID=663278 RepID=E6U334_ETHHY|nr:hypothetical protein [Ethanoligenens harbinense]ADU27506.1 hypothetical protein Ethha_1988 [Ethanoligenens harbinense YUAN-3]AVQ96561.1 hypothetical protein CXQ68_10185 [Ethanoligenens harbinense YUAN-3]AYF39222.1 hypothetical protein CXP51_10075 [Ethanoligenens harbinense]AYF42046.1 hypothetical protein CN246_10625 [Ethanoligenens harbinense]QCN92801.1 hypothetical protein DRA42_10215 [Ethanoligenens harbinense]